MEVLVDVTHEHNAEVTTIVYEVVRIWVAASNAVTDVREVNSFQSSWRDVVVLITEWSVELTGANLEFWANLPSSERVHHLDVLLTVTVGRTSDTVESFDLETEVYFFRHLTVQEQAETLSLERRGRSVFVAGVVPASLEVTRDFHWHLLQEVSKVTLWFSHRFSYSFGCWFSDCFRSHCFFCKHSWSCESSTAKKSKDWFLHNVENLVSRKLWLSIYFRVIYIRSYCLFKPSVIS